MKVIITRPKPKITNTIKYYQQLGLSCFQAPCIDVITAPGLKSTWLELAQKTTCLIVLSSHAIEHALRVKKDFFVEDPGVVIAVGAAVQREWKKRFGQDIINAGGNSEAVIKQIQQRKVNHICVLTAAGGREKIKQYALENRINLTQINCYQRKKLPLDLLCWHLLVNKHMTVLTATSGEILQHIEESLDPQDWQILLKRPVVVGSSRIGQLAEKQGFLKVIVAQSPSNQDMAKAVLKC